MRLAKRVEIEFCSVLLEASKIRMGEDLHHVGNQENCSSEYFSGRDITKVARELVSAECN